MEQEVEDVSTSQEALLIKWTDEDNHKLLLAYHILYFNPKFSNHPRRCINWRLLDGIYHRDQPGDRRERIRRTTIASRQVYNLLKTFRWRTEYYRIAERVAVIGECTIDDFKGMFDYYASRSVDEQALKGLMAAKYVPLPPFDTLTMECRRRLPDVHLKIMDAPFASEPEDDIAAGVKRLRLDLVKTGNVVCTDALNEKAVEWARDNNLINDSHQVNSSINWFLKKEVAVDLEQDLYEMKDAAFERLVEMAMRGQVEVTPELRLVDHRLSIDSSSHSCIDAFLWFDETASTVDHDLFKTLCARIMERFGRDYALELDNLSDLSPLLTKGEVSSVLEFLVSAGRLGKEGTIYYYDGANTG